MMRTTKDFLSRVVFRAEALFLIVYFLSLIFGLSIKTDDSFARLLMRVLLSAYPLTGIALWFLAMPLAPKRFWKFALVFFASNYVLLSVLIGIRVGFGNSGVYFASYLSLQVLLVYSLPFCLIVTIFKYYVAATSVLTNKKLGMTMHTFKLIIAEAEKRA